MVVHVRIIFPFFVVSHAFGLTSGLPFNYSLGQTLEIRVMATKRAAGAHATTQLLNIMNSFFKKIMPTFSKRENWLEKRIGR